MSTGAGLGQQVPMAGKQHDRDIPHASLEDEPKVPEPRSEAEEGAVLAGYEPVGQVPQVPLMHHPFDPSDAPTGTSRGAPPAPPEAPAPPPASPVPPPVHNGPCQGAALSPVSPLHAPTSGRGRLPHMVQLMHNMVPRATDAHYARRDQDSYRTLHDVGEDDEQPGSFGHHHKRTNSTDGMLEGMRARATEYREAVGSIQHALRDTPDAASELAGAMVGKQNYHHPAASGGAAQGSSPPPSPTLFQRIRGALTPTASPPQSPQQRKQQSGAAVRLTRDEGHAGKSTAAAEQTGEPRAAGRQRAPQPPAHSYSTPNALSGSNDPAHALTGAVREARHVLMHPQDAASEMAGRMLGKGNYHHG